MSVSRFDLTVVVPCYNEEEVLPRTLETLADVCRAHNYKTEFLFVDDGSKDRTWEILHDAARTRPDVTALRLSRNFGHQRALAAGLAHASGNRILIIDADLQDPPELIPRMMALMDQGWEMVYGQRQQRDGETFLKKLTASAFYRFINWITDIQIPKDTGDFRLISRKVLDAYLALKEDRRFIRLMFAWIGFKSTPLLYRRAPRAAGVTKYNYRRMINLALDGITSFSVRPLKVALFFAFAMAVAAALGIIWTVWSWMLGGTVQGWASVVVFMLGIGACQLLVLGIIGEYLGRLFIEHKQRPSFIIAEKHSSTTA